MILINWLRSLSGEERQVSFFSKASYIDALSPDGRVVFKSGARLYLDNPGQLPTALPHAHPYR